MMSSYNVITPYNVRDSHDFYHSYYADQVGSGIQVYKGRRTMSGRGLGSVFSGIMRAVAPVLKSGAKTLAKRGMAAAGQIAGDVMEGKSFKNSAKSRLKSSGKELLGDLGSLFAPSTGRVAKRKRKTTSKKRTGKRAKTIFNQ